MTSMYLVLERKCIILDQSGGTILINGNFSPHFNEHNLLTLVVWVGVGEWAFLNRMFSLDYRELIHVTLFSSQMSTNSGR